MPNWEYKTVDLCVAALAAGKPKRNALLVILNRMGQQGWEFVCFLDKSYSNAEDPELAMDPSFGLFKRVAEHQAASAENDQKT